MMDDKFEVATSDLCGEHRYCLKNYAAKEWHVYLGLPQHVSYPDSENMTLDDETEERLAKIVVNQVVRWIIAKESPRDIFAVPHVDTLDEETQRVVTNGLNTLETCQDKLHPVVIDLVWRLAQIRLETPLTEAPRHYALSTVACRVGRAVSFYVAQGVTSKTMKVGEQSAQVKCTQDTWWTTLALLTHTPHDYDIASAHIGLTLGLQTSPEQFKGITKIGFFNPNLNTSCVYALDKEKLGD